MDSMEYVAQAMGVGGGAKTLAQIAATTSDNTTRLLDDLARLQAAGRIMRVEGTDAVLYMPTALGLNVLLLRQCQCELAAMSERLIVATRAVMAYAPEVEQ